MSDTPTTVAEFKQYREMAQQIYKGHIDFWELSLLNDADKEAISQSIKNMNQEASFIARVLRDAADRENGKI